MSRPLRIEYPGAMYHVMDRGNQRQDVLERKEGKWGQANNQVALFL